MKEETAKPIVHNPENKKEGSDYKAGGKP